MKRNFEGFTITRNSRINITIFCTAMFLFIISNSVLIYFLKPEFYVIFLSIIAWWQLGYWSFKISEYLHKEI